MASALSNAIGRPVAFIDVPSDAGWEMQHPKLPTCLTDEDRQVDSPRMALRLVRRLTALVAACGVLAVAAMPQEHMHVARTPDGTIQPLSISITSRTIPSEPKSVGATATTTFNGFRRRSPLQSPPSQFIRSSNSP
jgi:hypothetical protein